MGRQSEARQYEGGTNYIATQTQYDALGRAYKTSNPFRPWQSETALWTVAAFDALGRVTSVTTPDSAVAFTSYLGNAVTVTDQAGKARKSVADALGRTTAVYEDPSGVNYQTSYAYDTLDDLVTVTQGVQTRTFVYDSLKRLTSATNPESGTVTFGYDNNGNLTSRLDARNITATMAYDVLNRITSKSFNDSPQTPAVNYFYDAQTLPVGAPAFDRGFATGRLVAVTYGGTSAGTYRGYDQMGQVVRQYQRTDSVNYLVEASYYANGSVHNFTYPAVPGAGDRRTASYTNDSAGRTGSITSAATSYGPAASVSSVGYAAHGGLATQTYGNNLINAVSYNNRLQPIQLKLGTSGSPTSIISLVYSYGTTNNNGNVQSVAYTGGGLSYTQTFAYDALNRLTTAQENSGSNWSQTNGYDRYGNRWIDLGGGNQSLYFTASNNRITGSSYDNAGNLLNDGVHSYTYDAENKISKVDGVSAYVYDGNGQRVRKLVGENVRFVYGLSGQLIAEYSGSTGALTKEYIYGPTGLLATIEPTALNSNGTRYVTPDHLGSPRVITNSSAGVVSRHDYKPFGEEIGSAVGGRTAGMGFGIAEGLRKKFTSHDRDSETGLDYMQARYFNAIYGRFISADSVAGSVLNPQTMNLYAYVANNPLRYIDPTGHMLSDIGVYQTANPEVERRVARAEDEGVKNWVASQQSEPKPVTTQTATLPESETPRCHMCFGQIPTTVVVDQMNDPGARVRPVGGNDRLTVGVDLRFTFLDQDGNPIIGSVIENVEPAATQASGSVPLDTQGRAGDLVSNAFRTVPVTADEQRAAINYLNQDYTNSQTVTISVVPDNGVSATVVQQRTLTNTTRGTPAIAGGAIRGYSFTMKSPTMRVP